MTKTKFFIRSTISDLNKGGEIIEVRTNIYSIDEMVELFEVDEESRLDIGQIIERVDQNIVTQFVDLETWFENSPDNDVCFK
jgi:hypothetical protein